MSNEVEQEPLPSRPLVGGRGMAEGGGRARFEPARGDVTRG